MQGLGALAAVVLPAAPLALRLLAPVFVALFGSYLYGARRFFGYLYREEGAGFALAGIFVHWANSVVIVSGAAFGLVRYGVEKMSGAS